MFKLQLLLIAAGCALLESVSAQPPAVTTPYGKSEVAFTVRKVENAPVYYVVGFSGVPGAENEGHTSNAGFVITEKGVVVYDALGTPALGYRLLQSIRAVTDKPVTHVVAGHYHADHVYGLQAFREHTKADVWAQEAAWDYINGGEGERRLAQRREALFPWVDEGTFLVRPDNTFGERHVFDMGDTLIELIHAGTAHAPDDTVMVVRRHGVVFTGDLVFGGRLPFLAGDGVNTRNWLDSLEYLQSLDPEPRFVIPGHGMPDPDARTTLVFTRDYIAFLRSSMAAAVENLETFESAYSTTDWSKYRNTPTFDAANRGNAYRVFLEMESELFKQPDGQQAEP